MPPITFTYVDFQGVDHEQNDPLVIIMKIESFDVKKILVNQGSLVDILY